MTNRVRNSGSLLETIVFTAARCNTGGMMRRKQRPAARSLWRRLLRVVGWLLVLWGVVFYGLPAAFAILMLHRVMGMTPHIAVTLVLPFVIGVALLVWDRHNRTAAR